ELLPVELGAVGADDPLLLQPHAPTRALRGREVDALGELVVRQPRILLQMGEQLAVEVVYMHGSVSSRWYHACLLHRLAKRQALRTHLAPAMRDTASIPA